MDLGHQWPSRLTLSEKIHSWLSLHHPVCLRIQHKWFKINVFIADLRLSGFTYTLIFQTIVRGNFEIKNHRKNAMGHGICTRFWDGPKFEPFSFSLISARTIDHVPKFWDGKFEQNHFCHEFHFFEFWSISEFLNWKKWAISEFWHVIDISSWN